MTKNEEFEKWDEENDKLNLPVPMRILAAWNARQPEIDALILKNAELEGKILKHQLWESEEIDALKAVISTQQDELFKFRAEVERLRADAERYQHIKSMDFALPPEITAKNADAVIDAMKETK